MERVIVVIDRSTSMRGTPLKLAKEFGKRMNPTSIWAFDTNCIEFEKIDDITYKGATNISRAMQTVFNDMKNQNRYQKQTLYFITDADDDVSEKEQVELIKTWKYLKQKKHAVGKAHFFGKCGSRGDSKDFLKLCYVLDCL